MIIQPYTHSLHPSCAKISSYTTAGDGVDGEFLPTSIELKSTRFRLLQELSDCFFVVVFLR